MGIHLSIEESDRKTKNAILYERFIGNRYISCEELFPCWMTAHIMLRDFCDNTKYWQIVGDEKDLTVSLEYPLVKDLLSGELESQILFFPEEDRGKIFEIINKLHSDYVPEGFLDKYVREINNIQIKDRMINDLRDYECEIINLGGRSILKELRFRLGVA